MNTPFTIGPIFPTLHDKIQEQITLAKHVITTARARGANLDGMDVVIVRTQYPSRARTLKPEYLGFRFEPADTVLPGDDLTNQDGSVSHVHVVLHQKEELS